MEQTASSKGIEPHERLGLFPRLETMHAREKKLIGTGGKPLERRQRVRAATEASGVDRACDGRTHFDQSVTDGPGAPAACPTADDGTTKGIVQTEEVMCATLDGGLVARVEQRLQHGQVVFEIVNRPIRIGR